MKKLTHKFVECMPEKLEPDVIYVSLRFNIVSHNCCCGCGNEVVTPLSPAGWELIYDGETASLYPSIGNWGLPCRSHYCITRNAVDWAETWSKAKIRRVQEADALARHRYITRAETPEKPDVMSKSATAKVTHSLWSRARKRWF